MREVVLVMETSGEDRWIMAISCDVFGTLDGQDVESYELTNGNGLSARLITFGARLVSMKVPDRNGALADIVLGFDDLAGYVDKGHYFGATVGRYGNRIRDSAFALDGKTYRLSANEGRNHLHGGTKGFDRHVWAAFPDDAANAVSFAHVSPDADQGYPGEVAVKVRYALTDDDRLIIAMSATTDRPTILNLVNHAYWNAAGHGSGSVGNQFLTVHGDFYTPVGEGLLTTGEIARVAGTPFDFRQAKPIGRDLKAVPGGSGYDHNWILRGAGGSGLRPVAELLDPASGRGFSLSATEPGVQIYTSGHMKPGVVGKGNQPYAPYGAVTFETQKFPCSPSFAHFPSARLDPGQVYEHIMEFQFFAR